MTASPCEGKLAAMIVHEREPLNLETPPAALANNDLTGLDAFYVRDHGPVPELDPQRWRLRVNGLVERELELSLADLQTRFQAREVLATLQCAGNRRAGLIAVRDIPGEAPWGPGATGTARWRGVALADVLATAGLKPAARDVELVGADTSEQAKPRQRFGGSIPRRKATSGEVMLAWEMNGAPLPAEHGAPVRAVVPGYIGARSVKWLVSITARAQPSENYFYARAYRLLVPEADPDCAAPGSGIALGAISLNSDILVPADGEIVAAGPLIVTGYALAGDDREICRVDVSTDGGRGWRQAELLGDLGPWCWRRWRTTVELSEGPAEIVARAWDSAAGTQPEDPANLWNPKGYVNSAWARVAVTARASQPAGRAP